MTKIDRWHRFVTRYVISTPMFYHKETHHFHLGDLLASFFGILLIVGLVIITTADTVSNSRANQSLEVVNVPMDGLPEYGIINMDVKASFPGGTSGFITLGQCATAGQPDGELALISDTWQSFQPCGKSGIGLHMGWHNKTVSSRIPFQLRYNPMDTLASDHMVAYSFPGDNNSVDLAITKGSHLAVSLRITGVYDVTAFGSAYNLGREVDADIRLLNAVDPGLFESSVTIGLERHAYLQRMSVQLVFGELVGRWGGSVTVALVVARGCSALLHYFQYDNQKRGTPI